MLNITAQGVAIVLNVNKAFSLDRYFQLAESLPERQISIEPNASAAAH